jgi:glycolate oxidase iron-sulfur subunit
LRSLPGQPPSCLNGAMQTTLAANIKDTPQGREADAILRSCVHCGFCLATCPTYQLLGDELDSPRGRIYLMKQMLEGEPVTARSQLHLDRCLTCRSCETTCPSGVQYGKLLDIGRALTEERVRRRPLSALKRYALRKVLPHRRRFTALLGVARLLRGILPREIRAKLPDKTLASPLPLQQWPAVRHVRKVLLLEGCVQPALAPEVNLAAARVLDCLGISVIRAVAAGCCGAVAHHLSAHDETRQQLRHNIDAMWPSVESGVEAVIMTASACTAMLTDYGHLLREDLAYAGRAARVSALARDISEVVLANAQALAEALRRTGKSTAPGPRVAFQSPCTLQHALKIRGVVESLLREAGFTLTHVPDGHLCCGSAGTYSILQPELSSRLLAGKVAALQQGGPVLIATANIGCQTHIRTATALPVRHWIELLEARLRGAQLA